MTSASANNNKHGTNTVDKDPKISGLHPQGKSESPNSYYYYSSAPLSDRDKSLREYITVLFRYKTIIIVCAIIGLIVGALMHKDAQLNYSSSALVSIGSSKLPENNQLANQMRDETLSPDYVRSLVPLLKSYAIANVTLANNPQIYQRLFNTPLTFNRDKTPNIPVNQLDSYLGMISSTQIEDTSLIRISAIAQSPELAAQLANVHAESFIASVRKQRFVNATTNVEYLQKRLSEAIPASEQADRAMIAYAKQNSIPITSDTFKDENSDRYDSLIQHLSQAVEDRAHSEGQLKQLQQSASSADAETNAITWPIQSRISELEALRQQLQRNQSNTGYIQGIDTQLKGLRSLLKLHNSKKVEESRVKTRATQEKERLIRQEVENIKKQGIEQYDVKLELSLLIRKSQNAKAQLDDIRTRLEEAQIAAESDEKTVTIIDRALPPSSANSTKQTSSSVLGALIGLCFGVAIAFFIDLHDASIKTVSDLLAIAPVPLLGLIPVFANKKSYFSKQQTSAQTNSLLNPETAHPGSRLSDTLDMLILEASDYSFSHTPIITEDNQVPIVVKSPLSRESEAFRSIRTTLKYAQPDSRQNMILVTSAQKGDGKTTVSVNLAASLAQTSARTLLIDADLRMPSVHTHLNISRSDAGLVDALTSDNVCPNIIRTSIANLWVLPASGPCDTPAELLGGRKMKELLLSLQKQFDYVIIDTPPVGEIADALLLAQVVDGIVFVVRSGHTSKSLVSLTFQRMRQVQANVLGFALNGVHGIKQQYYS